jgi:hypothetical protein
MKKKLKTAFKEMYSNILLKKTLYFIILGLGAWGDPGCLL